MLIRRCLILRNPTVVDCELLSIFIWEVHRRVLPCIAGSCRIRKGSCRQHSAIIVTSLWQAFVWNKFWSKRRTPFLFLRGISTWHVIDTENIETKCNGRHTNAPCYSATCTVNCERTLKWKLGINSTLVQRIIYNKRTHALSAGTAIMFLL